VVTGLAVDSGGTVYISVNKMGSSATTSSSKVLALGADTTHWTELPVAPFNPEAQEVIVQAVAVDDAGVYVAGFLFGNSSARNTGYVLLLRRAG
jgi:hypothetical protein